VSDKPRLNETGEPKQSDSSEVVLGLPHPDEVLLLGADPEEFRLEPSEKSQSAAGTQSDVAGPDSQGSSVEKDVSPRATEFDHLPNAERANVDLAKFRDYSMNREHPQNDGKWKAWADLGYSIDSPEDRAAAAKDVSAQLSAQLAAASATLTSKTQYGPRIEVRTEVVGPNGRTGTLVTLWQYDSGLDTPRLVTNWLKTHK
jgi:hypothetical protein